MIHFKDEKNGQVTVFMNIAEFLKPKYVLMENVIEILQFANGGLGKYALCFLIKMHYQARLGILAAGNYDLPQHRMRVFLWGAKPNEKDLTKELPILVDHCLLDSFSFCSFGCKRVNLAKLETSTLWRYWKHFNLVSINPNPSKEQLINLVQHHFISQALIEVAEERQKSEASVNGGFIVWLECRVRCS